MIRRPLLVANWKMYKTVEQSLAFGRELLRRMQESPAWDGHRELVLCPTLPALWALARQVLPAGVEVGAQNLDVGHEGPLTGGVSGYLLAASGATFVIVGHSERRSMFGETDQVVAEKVRAALDYGLRPIICVGETAVEKNDGDTDRIVMGQVTAALAALSRPDPGVAFAYEPVWAIGTGELPVPEEANRIAAKIRRALVEIWGDSGREVRVLYGGSVNPKNVASFWGQQEIDGALVGGASLDVAALMAMATVAL